MKKIIAIAMLALAGCAHMASTTTQTNKDGATTVTSMSAYTLFDGKSDLAKAANHVTPTTSGTTVSGLDQSSSTSNIVAIINAAATAASKIP